MHRYWPLIVLAAGLSLLTYGFIDEIMFAGIPYQDPTPEISANYALYSIVASFIRWTGAVAFLVGVFAGVIRTFARKSGRPAVS